MTFQELEVESNISGRPYRESWEQSFRMHMEGSSRVPPPIKGWEAVHPQEMPMTYLNIRGEAVTCLGHPSEMWKYGWIGEPN